VSLISCLLRFEGETPLLTPRERGRTLSDRPGESAVGASTVVGWSREERPLRRSRRGCANATELRGDIAMKQHVLNDGDPKPGRHHHKPWQMAERVETYVTVAVVIAAVVLLAVLVYGVMNTGSGTPAWMH
jgi:hypothetical protein